MITVQATYKVQASFAEENKRNINTFLTEFKGMPTSKFLYHVFMKEDGVTFVHLAMYERAEVQQQVLATPSFVTFQQKRDANLSAEETVIENLEHLGSSLGLIK